MIDEKRRRGAAFRTDGRPRPGNWAWGLYHGQNVTRTATWSRKKPHRSLKGPLLLLASLSHEVPVT